MSYAGDITPQQAWDLLRDDPNAVLVDVRTDGEWRAIGIPDTAEIGKAPIFIEWVNNFGQRNQSFVDDLRANGVEAGPVVFLCRSGQRSVHTAIAATAAGIEPSYNVLEGFEGAVGPSGQRDVEGWKVLGLPWKQS
ncbi:rhodanese-like domain-containing protein [Antrihabitans sp. YC2-6]|uniref:rhodanese-like domain-containing protein n=1 Tax=Antrihabitans sp. YC2-6 TaxID=2799498 RepID=UPI0018F4E28A|nr:rhodanese-like domain-containing protein [Antrihabitans sp. YC2-6]MBJ8348546.1 rhodanese-like domain-containing protein [Antrihabitans sp. YC2-6]